MNDLHPALVGNLLAAVLPVDPGALWVFPRDVGGGRVRIVDALHVTEIAPVLAGDGAYPDPRDRATFLLLVDEGARRGAPVAIELGPTGLVLLRTLARWEDPPARERAIATVCRALAATAPKPGAAL